MKFVKGFRPTKTAKVKEIEAAPPREIPVLQQEYARLVSRAGELTYMIYTYEQELAQVNSLLTSVNQEAAARKDQDTAAAEESKADGEVEKA